MRAEEEVRTIVRLIEEQLEQVKQDYVNGIINFKQLNSKDACYTHTLDALKWVLGEKDYQNN